MVASHGYAALAAKAPLEPFSFERRDPDDHDLVLEILHCGICHSDIHFVNNDWGTSRYPMVPGHEIVGRVVQVGAAVGSFAVGDLAGIGCIVDSCRTCEMCLAGEEQACVKRMTGTYSGVERKGSGLTTQGGYSNNYVVDAAYAIKIPAGMDPAAAAPLLCAGITTYSPLRNWHAGPGMRVGVVGLGGLGHMAVKQARAMGAEVVMFTTSPSKAADAERLGAHSVVISTDRDQMAGAAGSLDLILDTVSADHDVAPLLASLRRDASIVMLGAPDAPLRVPAMMLFARKRLTGSAIGGIRETQDMIDFCAASGIVADIESIAIQQVGEAYQRMLRNDVKYRFVIDLSTLPAA